MASTCCISGRSWQVEFRDNMRQLQIDSSSGSWSDAHVNGEGLRAGVVVPGIALEREFDRGQAVAFRLFASCRAAPLMCSAGTR